MALLGFCPLCGVPAYVAASHCPQRISGFPSRRHHVSAIATIVKRPLSFSRSRRLVPLERSRSLGTRGAAATPTESKLRGLGRRVRCNRSCGPPRNRQLSLLIQAFHIPASSCAGLSLPTMDHRLRLTRRDVSAAFSSYAPARPDRRNNPRSGFHWECHFLSILRNRLLFPAQDDPRGQFA
jgi:hypothetical protein